MNTPYERLRHHVTGAIERGEATAIVAVEAQQEQRQIDAMKNAFPDAVRFHDPAEGRWSRPEHIASEIGEGRDGGQFYYENADMPPDRFYFATADEAWLDLWNEVGEQRDIDQLGEAN